MPLVFLGGLSLLFFLFLISSPIFYAVFLVCFSTVCFSGLIWSGVVSGLFGILLLLVYLGAIVILISYVCAVVPNALYSVWNSTGLLFVVFTVFCWLGDVLGLSVFSGPVLVAQGVWLSSVFYSVFGVGLFLSVVGIILIVLCASTLTTQVSSPFRSLS